MKLMNHCIFLLFLMMPFSSAVAQNWDDDYEKTPLKPFSGLTYNVEFQGSASKGKTPLWLNANKYGLSSLDECNGYLRAGLLRPLSVDSIRKWGIGYGVDMAGTVNYTSNVIVQQAFAEVRWLHGVLTVGSKEYPMELKNNHLSSGSQTFGINARPIPQVRIGLPEYYALPFTNGWLNIKGHLAYGWMTDDNWQHSFTGCNSRYADNVLYHSKAGYLKIGNENAFAPLSLELGLEMAAQFGGTSYFFNNDGTCKQLNNATGFKAYWNAFIPGGHDVTDGENYANVEGNNLGSWVARINYNADLWRFSFYADKYFEDHSAMFQLDYDGYGIGDEWNTKKDRKFFLYDLKDMMLGMELNLKYTRWVRDIVFEYLYTKYQSGPIYHDHTITISDHVAGIDDYYNHNIYTGWQHWGQVIGNPLYLSPIYNDDGTIVIKDNRFVAFHLGIGGEPTENLSYRILASFQQGLGTYDQPYYEKEYNTSFLVEVAYRFSHGWKATAAYGMDFGKIRGNNYGLQLTLSKSGLLKL